MGALHEGHLSLMRQGHEICDRVCATIFVNPKQFAPSEDFETYPRGEGEDVAKLIAEGVDLLFAPDVSVMYPDNFATTVSVTGVSDGLCGAARPGFFDGVATVVSKLLLQALPDVAIFGEKDYQQLLVIRQAAQDLNIPVDVVGGPTVREADGLAMSSRNAYLTASERAIAPRLYEVLVEAAGKIADGAPAANACQAAITELTTAGFSDVDYVEARDAASLAPITKAANGPTRVLAAVRLSKARLIDNVGI